MVTSTNQVRQFYVANALATGSTHVTDSSAAGLIEVKKTANANYPEVYFLYKGANTVMKSDMIPLKNVTYAKLIEASAMATPMKKVTVALDSNVNNGKPIAGQDYILRINFRQFFGMSDEDQYFKDAGVHATADMETTPKNFYDKMVESLNLSFSREIGATKTSNPYLTFTSSASGITIEEKEQPWTRDVEAQERVLFEVFPTTVYVDGDDVIWGTVTPAASTTSVGNGKKIASLEWFLAGEKGDQYRMMGYPNYIPTEYMVDPTKTYDVLEIHYAFTDTGVNSYRTEKDITIAVPSTGGAIQAIAGAFNTAGIEIEGYTANDEGD